MSGLNTHILFFWRLVFLGARCVFLVFCFFFFFFSMLCMLPSILCLSKYFCLDWMVCVLSICAICVLRIAYGSSQVRLWYIVDSSFRIRDWLNRPDAQVHFVRAFSFASSENEFPSRARSENEREAEEREERGETFLWRLRGGVEPSTPALSRIYQLEGGGGRGKRTRKEDEDGDEQKEREEKREALLRGRVEPRLLGGGG